MGEVRFSTDIFIKDRYTNEIHRIGDDPHDSLYVDDEGTLHYYNMQTGDGCIAYNSKKKVTISEAFPDRDWGAREDELLAGYEFVTCRKECEYCEYKKECPFDMLKEKENNNERDK